MRLFFSAYFPTFPATDVPRDDATIPPAEPVLFAATSGGGGKREGQDADDRLPGKPPASPQPTDQTGDAPGAESDAPAGEAAEDGPGLQPKNPNYFKSDTTPDTGIGNA